MYDRDMFLYIENMWYIPYNKRKGGSIILTNSFIKKTQKTPRKEIELAKKYRADYKERIEKEWEH